jgi:hypothetical protein
MISPRPHWPRRNLGRKSHRADDEPKRAFEAMIADLGARMTYWTRIDEAEAEAEARTMSRPAPPATPARPRPVATPATPRPAPSRAGWYSEIPGKEGER